MVLLWPFTKTLGVADSCLTSLFLCGVLGWAIIDAFSGLGSMEENEAVELLDFIG